MFKRDKLVYQVDIAVLGMGLKECLKTLKANLKSNGITRYTISTTKKTKYYTTFKLKTSKLLSFKRLSDLSDKNIFLTNYSILTNR